MHFMHQVADVTSLRFIAIAGFACTHEQILFETSEVCRAGSPGPNISKQTECCAGKHVVIIKTNCSRRYIGCFVSDTYFAAEP